MLTPFQRMDDRAEDATRAAGSGPPAGPAVGVVEPRSGERAPDLDAFLRRHADAGVTTHSLRQLHALLLEMDGEQPWLARLEWLTRLARWVKRRPRGLAAVDDRAWDARRTRRLGLLLQILRDEPTWRRQVRGTLRSVLVETAGYRLFTETGLPTGAGVFSDAARRLVERFLPRRHDRDLSEVLAGLCWSRRDARWLESLPAAVVTDVVDLLHDDEDPEHDPWAPAWTAMGEALLLLAARVAALGLDEDVRTRTPEIPIATSPFLRLCHASEEAVAALRAAGGRRLGARPDAALIDELGGLIARCRAAVVTVGTHLEEYGTSVELIFHLEKITGNLDRIETLLAVLAPPRGALSPSRTVRVVAGLVRDQVNDRRVRALLHRSLHQLSRRIVESAGEHGGHYITRTAREWLRLLRSAAGGGFLTAGTTLAKFALSALPVPPFFAALFASTNYAVSFLCMQALGFTLATKQPSMTAAALASALGDHPGEPRHDAIVTLIARTCRSQIAAALGNVGMVIPTLIAVDFLSRGVTGHGVLTEKSATYVIQSLHPWKSLTIPFAALTGVFLWLASVGAGWLENFVVYHRLPEAIAQSRRLRALLGRRPVAWLSSLFSHHHAAGVGGNVTLGVLLGTTPVLGTFFGVPLDVRHITLSTGAFTLAVMSSRRFTWSDADSLAVIGGLIGILALNFGVSFYLALRVALRAHDVDRANAAGLRRAIFRRMLRAPWQFVVPPLGRLSRSEG
jgi:site-specific recombinase